MNIILIGYMASGKTTIGKELSKKTKLPFIDLDSYIESKENKTVRSIFNEDGEIYFRLKESEYLKEIIESKNNYILSLGGGTPCYGTNMNIIKANENSRSFYLKASLSTLKNRLLKDKNSRPLISIIPKNKLEEFISKHLFERSFYYLKANNTIDVNNKSLDEIVTEITQVIY